MGGMTYLLLLLWASVTVSTALDLQKRIINGKPCEREYHVKLRGVAADGSSTLCGGSLITERWILTAAHCLEPGGMFANVRVDPKKPKEEVKITAAPVIYKDKDKERSHDIMLLQLPMPSVSPPVALPDCKNLPKMVQVAGYGATTGGLSDERKPGESSTLNCADFKVVKCDTLSYAWLKDDLEQYVDMLHQHWFCGQSPDVDICYGDSGGGAVYDNKIYGVVSSGYAPRVCRKPAAFMDLCNPEYDKWIRQTIK